MFIYVSITKALGAKRYIFALTVSIIKIINSILAGLQWRDSLGLLHTCFVLSVGCPSWWARKETCPNLCRLKTWNTYFCAYHLSYFKVIHPNQVNLDQFKLTKHIKSHRGELIIMLFYWKCLSLPHATVLGWGTSTLLSMFIGCNLCLLFWCWVARVHISASVFTESFCQVLYKLYIYIYKHFSFWRFSFWKK